MISGLIDELNKSADEWNGSNMFELARMCRNAADTICELRGALQVASVDYRHLQDENARLRSCLSDDAENAKIIMADNDRLRELVEDMLDCIEIRAAFNRPPTTKMYEEFAQQARELGVEVDA